MNDNLMEVYHVIIERKTMKLVIEKIFIVVVLVTCKGMN